MNDRSDRTVPFSKCSNNSSAPSRNFNSDDGNFLGGNDRNEKVSSENVICSRQAAFSKNSSDTESTSRIFKRACERKHLKDSILNGNRQNDKVSTHSKTNEIWGSVPVKTISALIKQSRMGKKKIRNEDILSRDYHRITDDKFERRGGEVNHVDSENDMISRSKRKEDFMTHRNEKKIIEGKSAYNNTRPTIKALKEDRAHNIQSPNTSKTIHQLADSIDKLRRKEQQLLQKIDDVHVDSNDEGNDLNKLTFLKYKLDENRQRIKHIESALCILRRTGGMEKRLERVDGVRRDKKHVDGKLQHIIFRK